MDQYKKKLLLTCGLIFLSAQLKASDLPSTKIGIISQSFGQVSYLSFKGPSIVHPVKRKSPFYPDGSYLTKEDSFLTAKFFEGSFLRASPKTKFSVEYDISQKMATVHLFTGSLKILISNSLNKGKLEKIVIKSADVAFESSESKFSVVRNPVMSDVSVYVEKGSVQARVLNQTSQEDLQLIHTMEGVTIKDKIYDIGEPHKLTAREKKWLHANFYLRPIGRIQN